MSKKISFLSLMFVCICAMMSCSDDEDEKEVVIDPVANPITSVSAVDGDAALSGVISEIDHTIKFSFANLEDISSVKVSFTIAKDAKLKTPEENPATLNLTEPVRVIVNNAVEDITYTMTATAAILPDDYEKMGWTKQSKNFGELPEHINIYNTTKLNGVDNEVGWIAVIDGDKATMDVVGGGSAALKTLPALEKENTGWNVSLVGVNSTIKQLMVSGGKINQYGPTYTSAAIGVGSDGKYKMAYSYVIDEKLYAFDNGMGANAGDTDKANGTEWNAVTAVSGVPMVLRNGNILSYEDVMANDGTDGGWYAGDAKYARAAIGITATNQVICFVGQQVTPSKGISMLDLAKVMKDLKCTNAMSLEGSSSPNMHVNGKETALNSNFYDKATGAAKPGEGKAYQCAIVFK